MAPDRHHEGSVRDVEGASHSTNGNLWLLWEVGIWRHTICEGKLQGGNSRRRFISKVCCRKQADASALVFALAYGVPPNATLPQKPQITIRAMRNALHVAYAAFMMAAR